jgi:hypothetical protein
MSNKRQILIDKYPPSTSCSCEVCLNYCKRPGWWTVYEAEKAIKSGFASRMMLEMAPDRSFGVLSPAFKGCEMNFALQAFASKGCNFLNDDRCELYHTGNIPLECRFCHHDRKGLGPKCHTDLEKDWNTPQGQALVVKWSKLSGFAENEVFRSMGAFRAYL